MIVDIIPYDDYNSTVPTKDMLGYIGSITTHIGNSALRTSWKIIEVMDDSDSWKCNTDKAGN